MADINSTISEITLNVRIHMQERVPKVDIKKTVDWVLNDTKELLFNSVGNDKFY